MGELKRLTRLVQRRHLKDQIKLLKQIITTHEPLVKAMEVTRKAYQEGVQAGFQKAVTEIEAAEQEKLLKAAQAAAIPPVSQVEPGVIISSPEPIVEAQAPIIEA